MNDDPVSLVTDRGLVDAHLSLALEANQMGTWEWDIATNRVVWSSMLEQIHGFGAGRGHFDGTFEAFARDIHPADRARMLDSIAAAVSGEREHCLEYRIIRPDGSIRWLEARGRLLRDAHGKPERLVGVCSDITERKEATLRLQLSEAFYSATIMSVAEAVITTDPEGRVTLMNGVAEALTGWRLDEGRGRPFHEVVHIIDDSTPLSDRLASRPNARPALGEEPSRPVPCPESGASPAWNAAPRVFARRRGKRLARRDGSMAAIDDSAAPIRDVHGEIVGQVVVFRDVTEERQAEERRRFIAEASALLTSSLDFEKTLATIAQLAVPRISDFCAIHAIGEDGLPHRLVVTHWDPVKTELAASLERYESPERVLPKQVVQTGQSVFVTEITEERLRAAATNDEHFQLLRALGLRSYMTVPLKAGEAIVGAISFLTSEGPPLDPRDLHMAEELGRRAGMAMENARLYREAQSARMAAESSAARSLLIQELTAALSEAPTPSIVTEVVASLGTKAIGAAAVSVYELASSGEELVLVRSMGNPSNILEGYQRISTASDVPICEAVKTGRPLFFRDKQEIDSRYSGLARPVAMFASWAALPLEVEGRRLGALGISFEEARAFDETERDFIVTISRFCAQALERANLYAAAQKARAEAETARRTRENLLAVVSHDLRNPLSAIATTASVLIKADPLREPREKLVRYGTNILRTARRMDGLIVDLLDLAKIEAGHLLLEPRLYDASSLIRESVEILAPVAGGKGLVLTADLPVLDFGVFCDRERILQVLSNLVGNALKFTAEGGRVTVSAREQNGEVQLAVRDTGCGIQADQLPHIFDRYWQAKGAREGMGLGLSIAKGIVDAHHGTIWVETQLGQGTTFFFKLPQRSYDADASNSESALAVH